MPQPPIPSRQRAVLAALGAVLLLAAPAVRAATVTDVMDGFAAGDDDPVDVRFTPSWELRVTKGRILREFRCLSEDTAGVGSLCPEGSGIGEARELDVERRVHVLNLDTEVALWRHASLTLRLPIVLFDQTELTHADGVNALNSTVDPANEFPPASLFSVPFTGPERSGLADPTVGVRITPLSLSRDMTRPTWALDLNLTIPRLQADHVKQADNDAVGEGVWVLDLATALSARPRPWVEPYFQAGGTLRFAAATSLFEDYGPTQTLVSPGHGLHTSFGVEFIPWEQRSRERQVVIDVGGSLGYRFEGREYTALFDALGSSDCDPRDSQEPCDLTTFDRREDGRRRQTDGITDVEQYATLSSWIGVRYQPIPYFTVAAKFTFAYEMPHFLTFADAGKDLDGRNQVERENSEGVNEFNPVYNSDYDGLGHRFRSGGLRTTAFSLSVTGKF
ncbi:MAG: hypothetical protein ACQEXJ_18310 [Myxococcota bacterium]